MSGGCSTVHSYSVCNRFFVATSDRPAEEKNLTFWWNISKKKKAMLFLTEGLKNEYNPNNHYSSRSDLSSCTINSAK
jgi:hypothetical protein